MPGSHLATVALTSTAGWDELIWPSFTSCRKPQWTFETISLATIIRCCPSAQKGARGRMSEGVTRECDPVDLEAPLCPSCALSPDGVDNDQRSTSVVLPAPRA